MKDSLLLLLSTSIIQTGTKERMREREGERERERPLFPSSRPQIAVRTGSNLSNKGESVKKRRKKRKERGREGEREERWVYPDSSKCPQIMV